MSQDNKCASIKEQKVFISYAREDQPNAKRIYNDLKKKGAQPWLDVNNLRVGVPWKREITIAIENSDFFLALLSNNSVNKRGFVQAEVKLGLKILDELPKGSVYIIPARLSKCSPSHHQLRDLNWVDLFPSWKLGVERILDSLGLKGGENTSINVSGVWKNKRVGFIELQQNGFNMTGKYRYPRFYTSPSVIPENFPESYIEGKIIGDLVIYRWEDPVENTSGVGYWRIEETKLTGYWYWETEEFCYQELIRSPALLMQRDTKYGTKSELYR